MIEKNDLNLLKNQQFPNYEKRRTVIFPSICVDLQIKFLAESEKKNSGRRDEITR